MGYYLGVDLGTTYTAAAVWREGRVEIANLGNRAPVIPSVVFLKEDESVLTGEAANRRGVTQPGRVAREFKRRIGDTTPIFLGGSPYSADALTAKLLRWVVDAVSAVEGSAPDGIAVAHPANWGPFKLDLLRQAVERADLDDVTILSEPEAAAIHYASQSRVEPGSVIAVFDLGGGTFDAAVLHKTEAGFELLGAPRGIERLGGIDFDEAVFQHVLATIGTSTSGLDHDDAATVAAVARLRQDCVEAKEALSSDTDVAIPVWLPHVQTEIRLTRVELEHMIRPALADTITALQRALRSAGVAADEVTAVLLVGGSSRIPLVAELVGGQLGRPVAVDAHPKHGIALGAAIASAERARAGQAESTVVSNIVETDAPAATTQVVVTPPVVPPPVVLAPAEPDPAEPTPPPPTAPAEPVGAGGPPGFEPMATVPLAEEPPTRRSRGLLVGAVVAAAVAAAVAFLLVNGGDPGGLSTGATTVPPRTQPSPTPLATPSEGPACPEGLKLAFFGALTGDSASLGVNIKQGAELAIDEWNEENPDCQVGLEGLDSQGDAAQASALAQHAVEDGSIVGVIGPAFSGESLQANPLFEEAGLPVVTPSATRIDLADQGWTIFHRTIANDAAQGPRMAKYTVGTGATTVAVIDDASEYGIGLADVVRSTLSDEGGTLSTSESIDPAAQDYSATVNKIAGGNPDAVVYCGYYAEAGRFVKQLRDVGYEGTFVAGDGVLDPGFVAAAGSDAAEGAVITCPCAPAPDDYGTAYEEAFGQAAGSYSPEAYDAANIFLEAINAGNYDRGSINTFISNIDYQGITKHFKFDERGELAVVAIYAYRVEGGEIQPGEIIE